MGIGQDAREAGGFEASVQHVDVKVVNTRLGGCLGVLLRLFNA